MIISGSKAKSGKTRFIPLNREALDIISKWRVQKRDDNYTIPNKQGKRLNNVRKAWLNILKEANISSFRWHDMRHHFASKLVVTGVDLNTVRELLGHSDLSMTLRYAHLAPEHKTRAVEMLIES